MAAAACQAAAAPSLGPAAAAPTCPGVKPIGPQCPQVHRSCATAASARLAQAAEVRFLPAHPPALSWPAMWRQGGGGQVAVGELEGRSQAGHEIVLRGVRVHLLHRMQLCSVLFFPALPCPAPPNPALPCPALPSSAWLPHGQQVMRHCCLCPAGAGLAGDVAKLGALGAAQVPHATGRGGREGCIQAGYAAAGSGVSGAGNGGWRRRGTTSAGHCIGWHLTKGGVPPSQPPQLALQPAGQAAPALCTPARPPDGAPACGLELHNGAPPPSSLHRCSARAVTGRATGSWPTGALAAGESSAGEAVGQ